MMHLHLRIPSLLELKSKEEKKKEEIMLEEIPPLHVECNQILNIG